MTHHISQQTVVRVLHDQPLYPFYVQHVQAVQLLLDYEFQETFCKMATETGYCISNLLQLSVVDG
jgi:hypothetical protein